MMAMPNYVPVEGRDFHLPMDKRSHGIRQRDFFLRILATARALVGHPGRQHVLTARHFQAESPTFAAEMLQDLFEVSELEAVRKLSLGPHTVGDVTRLMSVQIAFVAYADIMAGCLFDLVFFQALVPGATLVCVQQGASGDGHVAAGFEPLRQYFFSKVDIPTVKFLRVERSWQDQFRA